MTRKKKRESRPRVIVRAKCNSKHQRVIVREIIRAKSTTPTHDKKEDPK